MKIALISDSHFDLRSRWDECLRIHDWIADDLDARDVDLVLHGGDWFERKSEPAEHNAVIAWLQRLAEKRPVIGVRGNHDAVGDLRKFNKIDCEYKVHVEETFSVQRLNKHDAGVACLAWTRKAEILARAGDVSQKEADEIASSGLANILRGFRLELEKFDGPRILLLHAMVTGSKTSGGETLASTDMPIGLAELSTAGADFVGLGHIHIEQEWEYNGRPIFYAGSPYARNYGELDDKSYILIETLGERRPDGFLPLKVERIITPRTPMVLLEARFDELEFVVKTIDLEAESGKLKEPRDFLINELPKGADVRFRYHYLSDHRDIAKFAAEEWKQTLLAAGASEVKLDPVETVTYRSRVPEIAQATDIKDKLLILWTARDILPDVARQQRLFSKAKQLEDEVRNTL